MKFFSAVFLFLVCFWFVFGLVVGSVSYYATAVVVRCAQVLYTENRQMPTAENYTSGTKQSLDSSRGNEVLLCCIIMGPLVSPWTRRKT